MTVGGCVALLTGAMMSVQAYKNPKERGALVLTALALLCGALAFFLTAPIYFQQVAAWRKLFSVMMGTASMFFGMCSFLSLFQPKFSKQPVIICGIICLLGYSLWNTGAPLGHWFFVCQMMIAVLTAVLLTTAKQTLTPQMRWLALGMCIFVAVGAIPRLILIVNVLFDPTLEKPQTASSEFRFGVLVWVLLPVLLYSIVMGVVEARAAKVLKEYADLDLLTGAFSRRYLFEVGDTIEKRRKREIVAMSILLIDVDHFNVVNDTWGHAIGDEVLKHCVKNIQEATRQTDSVVSRYGGEEFCVLLKNQSPSEANHIAERIRLRIAEQPFTHQSQTIPLTVSIGISEDSTDHSATTLRDLIALADKKLYAAKRSGRNRIIQSLDGLLPI